MNHVEIFKNPEFGSIRVIEENGKYLFCGSDMAKALGYSNFDTMRWQLRLPAHSCDFESHNHILDRKGDHSWKN